MNLGYELEDADGRLKISFKENPVAWDRFASQLVKDEVILDTENAKKKLEEGDEIVYSVYNVWKFIDSVKAISTKIDASSNITLLRHGVFSTTDSGELFLTYGHAHEKYYGEFYTILKNQCFIVLADIQTNETFIIQLKEGDSIFIHPKFLHRMVSYKKDVLMFDTSPRGAGHNYEIVKKKGFPFHVFYDAKRDEIKFVKNKKYENSKLKFFERIEPKINPIELLEKDPEKLKDILENPDRHKKIYFW